MCCWQRRGRGPLDSLDRCDAGAGQQLLALRCSIAGLEAATRAAAPQPKLYYVPNPLQGLEDDVRQRRVRAADGKLPAGHR